MPEPLIKTTLIYDEEQNKMINAITDEELDRVYGIIRGLIKKCGNIHIELKEIKEFARIVSRKQVRTHWLKGACLERYNREIKYNFEDYASDYMLTQSEFDLIKKVLEKYGK